MTNTEAHVLAAVVAELREMGSDVPNDVARSTMDQLELDSFGRVVVLAKIEEMTGSLIPDGLIEDPRTNIADFIDSAIARS